MPCAHGSSNSRGATARFAPKSRVSVQGSLSVPRRTDRADQPVRYEVLSSPLDSEEVTAGRL